MLTVAVARSHGACNVSFWTARCYQRAGRGFSASWLADSPVWRLINLIIESSCSTLTRAWWASWEDSLSTVTSLYDFFGTLAGEGCPCAWSPALSCPYVTRSGGTDHVGHLLFCWGWLWISTACAYLLIFYCCVPPCFVAHIALMTLWTWHYFAMIWLFAEMQVATNKKKNKYTPN